MDKITKTPSWVKSLETGWVPHHIPGRGTVTEVKIRIRQYEWFAIIRTLSQEGPSVAFTSARGLRELVDRINAVVYREEGRWREDLYA